MGLMRAGDVKVWAFGGYFGMSVVFDFSGESEL